MVGIYLFLLEKSRRTQLKSANIRYQKNSDKSDLSDLSDSQIKADESRFFPVCLIMEGSLFWQGFHYQNYVKKYLKLLGIGQDVVRFTKIANSSILAASQLVIDNGK